MINGKLLEEIKHYCSINNIDDIEILINKMIAKGFTIEKYGQTPSKSQHIPEKVEIEVIKEVIKEVPYEVIKEVPIEKIVEISNDVEINRLLKKIDDLEIRHENEINLFKDNRKLQTQQILKLNKEKDDLISEYEIKLLEKDNEINKLKSSRDLYGE